MTRTGTIRADAHRIVLVGLRGAGKTTVGRELALELACPFHDSDEEIHRRSGRTAAAWIENDGEPVFRAMESTIVLALAAGCHGVLALGGGAVLSPANRAAFDGWTSVWLDASDVVLCARIAADPYVHRPTLTPLEPAAEMARLRAERTPAYLAFRPLPIDTAGRTPRQVAQLIAERIQGFANAPADGGRSRRDP